MKTEFPELLREMAFLSELRGDNPFKIRALSNAADIFDESAPLQELVGSGEIKKMAGVGKGTQALVAEFLATHKLKDLEELKAEYPAGLLELREIRGLGAKKIKTLYAELGIASLSELEYACQENRLVDLKGFGEKTQASILKAIQQMKGYRGKVILPVALQESDFVQEILAELPGVKSVRETGELRRRAEVISSLDFVLETEEAAKTQAALAKLSWKEASPEQWEGISENGQRLRAWLAGAKDLGSVLFTTTGPQAFAAKATAGRAATEEEIFAKADLEFVPPECRDLNLHPKQLIEAGDIKGVFHLHTDWSDGKNTLEEMVRAAVELGYEYLGVSEHSQTAFYAHGLDEKRVQEQRKKIDELQEKFPQIRIFQGIESDILSDGSLDFPDSFLKKFDFVIGSVHGQTKMSREAMTKRLCRALEHPATTWLGHWSGRLLLGREPYEFDSEAVLKTAAKEGKSIELNSNPYRLDIDWRLLPRAAELGIPIGIFPDAHSTGGLADVKYGVMMARKAGLRRSEVVNTKSRKEMESWLLARKQ